MAARTSLVLALPLLLAPLACDGDGASESDSDSSATTGIESPCASDDRGDAYMVGLSRAGAQFTVEFVDALPAPPDKGDNRWQLRVLDQGGAAMDGAQIQVSPWMPDHGHGSPTEVLVEPMDGTPGEFVADPVNLFMAGLWEITVDVTAPDDVTDSVVFRFCIDP